MRSRLYRMDLKASPYAYIAPFFILFLVFGIFPLIYTVWLSFHTVTSYDINQMAWAGVHNYTSLWHNAQFWNALRNTVFIGVVSAVPQLMMALGLAHMLNYKL